MGHLQIIKCNSNDFLLILIVLVSLCKVLLLAGLAVGAPQVHLGTEFQAPPPGRVQFGVDAAGCLVGPSGKVCPTGAVQFTSEAHGVPAPVAAPAPTFRQAAAPVHPVHHVPAQHRFPVHPTFTGLVGPSGVIGPSGLVGPSGPVAFGR